MNIFDSSPIRSAFVFLAMITILPTSVSAEERPRTITVQGQGSVSTTPDMAIARAGVVTDAATPADAIAKNNAAVEALLATVRRFGIADRDIQTANFGLSPQYRRERKAPPQIIGYRVNNTVSIRVRVLENLGKLLNAMVGDGANQLNGIQFTVQKRTALEDQARVKAIADAKRRAELYAGELGVAVGRPLTINEGGSATPGPRFFRSAEARSASAVPIAPGEQQISARVSVVFEIR